MISTDKNNALQEWLSASPYATDIYFNFSPAEAGVTNVATVSGDKVLQWYMGGYAKKSYDFGVIQYLAVNTDIPNSTDNTGAMTRVEAFMNWVTEQDKLHNYPDFGEGAEIYRVEVLNSRPIVAGQDDEVAKYQFECRVTYIEKEY